MNNIIRKPIITEKATAGNETGRFTFEVERKANKLEIKNAIEKMYGVKITEVRTQIYGGGKSSVKYTNKGVVEAPSRVWKKAIVTVATGETIDLFNNF